MLDKVTDILETVALTILFAILLFVISELAHADYAENHVYIFGDSLSSPTGCEWPRMLEGEYAVHNYAQSGLSLLYMDMPSHLHIKKDSPVILYIGTNDAGQKVPLQYFRMKYKELIQIVKIRGGKPIAVRLPTFDNLDTREYSRVIEQVAKAYNVPVIDPGWGADVTVDGIHPTCGANTYLGVWFLQELYNVSE